MRKMAYRNLDIATYFFLGKQRRYGYPCLFLFTDTCVAVVKLRFRISVL